MQQFLKRCRMLSGKAAICRKNPNCPRFRESNNPRVVSLPHANELFDTSVRVQELMLLELVKLLKLVTPLK